MAIAGGGSLIGQVLAAGLLDELELHVAPVILGAGMRLLDAGLNLADKEAIELTPTRVIPTPEVTHIRYTVNGRDALVLDDRGSGAGRGSGSRRVARTTGSTRGPRKISAAPVSATSWRSAART